MTHKSVEKAIAVLNRFSIERQKLGVGEISRLTGCTKDTVSRILATLEIKGAFRGPKARANMSSDIVFIYGGVLAPRKII